MSASMTMATTKRAIRDVYGETLAQLKLVADSDTSLFQGIKKLVKGFVTKTAHVQLRLFR